MPQAVCVDSPYAARARVEVYGVDVAVVPRGLLAGVEVADVARPHEVLQEGVLRVVLDVPPVVLPLAPPVAEVQDAVGLGLLAVGQVCGKTPVHRPVIDRRPEAVAHRHVAPRARAARPLGVGSRCERVLEDMHRQAVGRATCGQI